MSLQKLHSRLYILSKPTEDLVYQYLSDLAKLQPRDDDGGGGGEEEETFGMLHFFCGLSQGQIYPWGWCHTSSGLTCFRSWWYVDNCMHDCCRAHKLFLNTCIIILLFLLIYYVIMSKVWEKSPSNMVYFIFPSHRLNWSLCESITNASVDVPESIQENQGA